MWIKVKYWIVSKSLMFLKTYFKHIFDQFINKYKIKEIDIDKNYVCMNEWIY